MLNVVSGQQSIDNCRYNRRRAGGGSCNGLSRAERVVRAGKISRLHKFSEIEVITHRLKNRKHTIHKNRSMLRQL